MFLLVILHDELSVAERQVDEENSYERNSTRWQKINAPLCDTERIKIKQSRKMSEEWEIVVFSDSEEWTLVQKQYYDIVKENGRSFLRNFSFYCIT